MVQKVYWCGFKVKQSQSDLSRFHSYKYVMLHNIINKNRSVRFTLKWKVKDEREYSHVENQVITCIIEG